MNLENYKALCHVCDKLLTDPKAGRVRIAIPWLHIVREHPHFLQQYEYLFNPGEAFAWLSNIQRLIRNLGGWVRQIARSWISTDDQVLRLSEMPRSVDLLIVSHLINADHLEAEKDFYFDALPGFLKRQGYSVVVVLINHTDRKFDEKSCTVCPNDGVQRIVLADTMSLSKTWSCFCAVLSEVLRLHRVARNAAEPLTCCVSMRAAVEALSGGARDAQQIAVQVADIVRDLNCHAVLTTYEGHAWERSLFHQVRQASSTVRCFAYQHAAVFRFQHGLKRLLGSAYDPDVIFASGDFPKAEFAKCGSESSPLVRVFGSSRAVAFDTIQTKYQKDFEGNVCLVLPEGLNSESAMMIRFASACAKELPNIRFVIRLHPAIQWASLKTRFPELETLPANVVFSKDFLDSDARRASWVLYRGTTAVVAGVQHGARPIYLQDTSEEMGIDPLFSLGDERAIVRTVDEFSECVLGSSLNQDGELERQKRIIDHCQALFSPLNFRVISACF